MTLLIASERRRQISMHLEGLKGSVNVVFCQADNGDDGQWTALGPIDHLDALPGWLQA